MKKNQIATVTINDRGVHVHYRAYYRPEANGMFTWFIPGFDIYYSSRDKESGANKSLNLTKSWLSFYERQSKLSELMLDLRKMGFEASDGNTDYKIMKAIKGERPKQIKFRVANYNTPERFKDSEVMEMENQFAIAS